MMIWCDLNILWVSAWAAIQKEVSIWFLKPERQVPPILTMKIHTTGFPHAHDCGLVSHVGIILARQTKMIVCIIFWNRRGWLVQELSYYMFNGLATLAEFTQKVPRKSIKCWALSGLFTKQKVPRILKKCKQTRQGQEFDRVPGHFLGKFWFVYTFFQTLGTFCCVNISERAQNLIEFLGTFWVNSANVASPL